MSNSIACRFVQAWLLLALAAPLAAQEPPATPEAIAVPEIAAQAEGVATRLREIDEALKPDPAVGAIRESLPGIRGQLAERARSSARQVQTLDLAELSELERQWRTSDAEVKGWSAALTRRAVELETRLAELEQLEAVWEKTRAAAAVGAPAEVARRAAQVVESIRQMRARVSERRGEILTLQNKVSEQDQVIASALDSLSRARAQARSQLFEAERPPLWSALASAASGEFSQEMKSGLARDLNELSDYVSGRRAALVMHALLLLLAIALVLYLRPRARGWAEKDEGFRSAARLFELPLAMGFLIGMFISPWVYPNAPPLLSHLIGLLLLLPLLRVLSPLLPETVRPALYALAGFYLLDRARDLLESNELIERCVLLIEVTLAFAGLLWLLRPARLGRIAGTDRWIRALRAAARVGVVLFASSLLFNVTGFVALAALLADAVLRSAYLAVIVYAAVTVFDGLLRALLRVWPLALLNVVKRHRFSIVRRARLWSRIAAILGWFYATLSFFSINEAVMGVLSSFFTSSFSIGSMQFSLGSFVGFGLTIAIAILLARLLRSIFDDDIAPRVSLPRGVGYATGATIQYVVAILGFVFAFGAAGIDMDRFALVAGAFSVGIGFGLQNLVNNFVSGLILLFERPVQLGDTLEVGEVLGDVKRIGIRSSTIRTWQGAEVIVPNSSLISERVVNWTMSDRQRRVEVRVGVRYGTDPARVLEILGAVARAHPDVLEDPAPTPLFLGFGASSLDFELRAWTRRFESFQMLQSDLAVSVNAALAEAGITIPFLQRDVNVTTVEPAIAPTKGAPAPRPSPGPA